MVVQCKQKPWVEYKIIFLFSFFTAEVIERATDVNALFWFCFTVHLYVVFFSVLVVHRKIFSIKQFQEMHNGKKWYGCKQKKKKQRTKKQSAIVWTIPFLGVPYIVYELHFVAFFYFIFTLCVLALILSSSNKTIVKPIFTVKMLLYWNSIVCTMWWQPARICSTHNTCP